MSNEFTDKNGNENCLLNMECPKCGQSSEFLIEVKTLVRMVDDGTTEMFDTEWDDENYIKCPGCNHAGVVREFTF